MDENKRFDEFHYHPQTNKKIDGIVLVPKSVPEYSSNIEEALGEEPLSDEEKAQPTTKSLRKLSGIILTLLLIFLFSILPIRILESASNMNAKAKESFDQLEDVYQSAQKGDYEKAKTDLLSISKNINTIDKDLDDIGQKNIFVSRFSSLKENSINDERFFDTVLTLSKIGNKLIGDFQFLNEMKLSDLNSPTEGSKTIQERVARAYDDLRSVGPDFQKIKTNLGKIDSEKMSEKEKSYLSLINSNLEKTESYYNAALTLTGKFPSIAGNGYDKKYLLVFQNNSEMRATGGFIGTYGILTISNGALKSIFVDSVYNPDGQITKKIDPPGPLKKITDNWAMRDSNWYPDFPTSAKNISDFYELEGGFTPDGIIAFDTKPFIDLLEITGPIQLDKYGIEIDKDNFIPITQFKTSVDYNPDDKNPKKFLADFTPILIEKLSQASEDNQNKIIQVLISSIKEKHIQFYSSDANIQKAFASLDIDGKIKQNGDSDYFYYVNSNIGGLKSNSEITESLNHDIAIGQNGKIIHTVQLTRNHLGTKDGDINYAYLRFYLPLGAKVLDIKNFEKDQSIQKNPRTGMIYLEDDPTKHLGQASVSDINIYTESDKTVAGGWQVLRPQETLVSEITYELPENIVSNSDHYGFLIQKQSGVVSQKTSVNIENQETLKKSSYSFDLTEDSLISLNLK